MAVTVIDRPIGHKLNTSDIAARVMDSAGEALVYVGTGHGLSDGDYVYIESNFDAYNGFKYVDSIAYDSFKIRESENGPYVQFKQEADISYRVSVLEHGWQCVHLPITYTLHSDLWPINEIEDSYTPRTITGTTNQSGYTGLNFSSDLINPNALQYLELIGTGPLAGVYKIIQDIIVNNAAVIDLAYNASNVFTGYEVRRYYEGYFITVNVYGGLDPSHPWADEKPIVLLSNFNLTPDSNGDLKFSISEILKGQINTRNNLTLDTLPNNIDFWTSFYISFSESYDTSDGETVTTYTGPVTTDSFVGYAMNSILPFKSLNSGHMSDFVSSGALTGQWLNDMDRPIAFVDRFFDLSLINNIPEVDIVIYRNGVAFITLTNPGVGVLRIGFIPTEAGEFCFVAYSDGNYSILPADFDAQTGSGTSWSLGANPSVTTSSGSKYIYTPIDTVDGINYNISITFSVTGTFSGSLQTGFFNSSLVIQDTDNNSVFQTAGTYTENFTLTANDESESFFIRVQSIINTTVTLLSISVDGEPIPITDSICIDVIEECGSTIIDDNARLLENTDLRLLE
jgi:hypothetical protein